tara:strand:+ start:2017 stop:2355 length:339 start_codon:yes stop_codon:yes gene_type:complete
MLDDPNEMRFEGTLFGGTVVNRTAVDQYTLLHIVSGVAIFFILKLFGKDWPILALILAIGWEIFEPMAKEWNPDVFPNPSKDSAINKTFDVIAVMVGYYGARMLTRRRTVNE